MITQPIILEGDFSYSLRVVLLTPEYLELEALMFSERFDCVDVAFEYLRSNDSNWNTDAVVKASRCKDNEIYGLPCSLTGSLSLIRWFYPKNSIARGDKCDIRLRILPSAVVLSNYGDFTYSENISRSGNKLNSGPMVGKVVNFGFGHKQLVVTPSSFIVRDCQGVEIFNIAINTPVWAQEKRDGNFIVLTDGGHIVEVNPRNLSTLERDVNLGLVLTHPKYLFFDELTENVLVAGNEKPFVYEVSWGGDCGQILKSTGYFLTMPIAAAYYPDRSRILIVDRGNPQLSIPPSVVKSNWSDVLETWTSVEVDEVQVGLHLPFIPVVFEDGSALVVEQCGERPVYNQTPSMHPSLVRSGVFSGVGKNALSDYRGIVFAPLACDPG